MRSSRVRWGVTIQRWGRHFDHGMVECTWKARVVAPKKTHNPDFAMLRDSNIAAEFDRIVSTIISSELNDPECTTAKHDHNSRNNGPFLPPGRSKNLEAIFFTRKSNKVSIRFYQAIIHHI